MTEFHEKNVAFTFDEEWACEKWDECDVYRMGISKLQGTQAVDFLGVHDKSLYLIEVKDFRGHRIENKDKLDEWANEIAWKVRDTIAGILGAAISHHPDVDIVAHCIRVIEAREADNVRVIAWILEDKHVQHSDRRKEKSRRTVMEGKSRQWREALGKRLAWLTTKVKHSNPLDDPKVPGVVARNLPHDKTT